MTTSAFLGTRYESSDLGNARRLVAAHGEHFLYAPELSHWLTWDGRRWANDVTGAIDRYAKRITDLILDEARFTSDEKLFRFGIRSQQAPGIAHMIQLAKSEPGVPVLLRDMDSDPYAFNVLNGTLDLRTGELHRHYEEDLITKLADVEYDPEEQCPTWLNTLEAIFAGDQNLIRFVQLFAGYSLTGDVSEQKMTFCHGGGSNGKTTVMNALRSITGDYGISLASDVLIDTGRVAHSTGITDLRGARFVTATETEEGRRFNEALVKQLTGGDPIKARRMRTDNFEFLPTHKLWISGNHLPSIYGTDDGIWRRMALVPFGVRFNIDQTLSERLTNEASGILTWAVQGCLAWQQCGLQIPDRVTLATKGYRESQDHLGRFLTDECIVGESFQVSSGALRKAYEAWCGDQGEPPRSSTAVGRELSNRGYQSKHTNKGNFWRGLGLAAEVTLI